MTRYVDSTEQLVTEIVVKDIKSSVDFYRRLGFDLLRDGGDFAELTWEVIAFFSQSAPHSATLLTQHHLQLHPFRSLTSE